MTEAVCLVFKVLDVFSLERSWVPLHQTPGNTISSTWVSIRSQGGSPVKVSSLPIEIDTCSCQKDHTVQWGQIGGLETKTKVQSVKWKGICTAEVLGFHKWQFADSLWVKTLCFVIEKMDFFFLLVFCFLGGVVCFVSFMPRVLQRHVSRASPART